MSIYRKNAKRDANEPGIIDTFVQMGCSVTPLSAPGVPDLLVGIANTRTVLVEVKSKTGKLTPPQKEWHEHWRGEKPYIIRSSEEAAALVISIRNEIFNTQDALTDATRFRKPTPAPRKQRTKRTGSKAA